ncbi:MAG: adenylate kinase [Acidobacteriota bacterium]|jgi:adenylate kinase
MRIVLLGPPGAGKGTQAGFLAEHHRIPHISTGDMLRQAIREGTEAGRRAEAIVSAGRLVPDDLVRDIVAERLAHEDCRDGFILDGYPRNLAQAGELEEILTGLDAGLDLVLELSVPEDEIVQRLCGRRTCPDCKAVFHVAFNPPRIEGRCDACGGELVQRDDDRESVIRERLRVYRETTAPLVDYYRKRGLLRTVSAAGEVKEVAGQIRRTLEAA